MKKTILLILCLFSFLIGQAQVSKTVNVTTAGSLYSILTDTELSSITNLTISGTINALDFETMRDYMPALVTIDISNVTIASYTGAGGPQGAANNIYTYLANTIPQYAFFNASTQIGKTRLTTIKMPPSITSIGEAAFDRCIRLSSITIPSTVTSIKDWAFLGCSSITSITIPDLVTSIGYMAFYECSGLTSITIPHTVTFIDDAAFALCSSLTSATISSSIIGNDLFEDCSSLTSVTLSSSIDTIGSGTFSGCSSLSSITIPSSVTTIGRVAFKGCSDLTSITISSSVTTIGDGAFSMSGGLITVDENNINYSSNNGVLFNKKQTQLIHCPITKKGNYTIPSSVDSILFDAFNSCSSLSSVTIPLSVTSIGQNAFSNCNSLTSITIPVSVNSISYNAFSNCSGLNSIYVNAATPLWLNYLNSFLYVFNGVNTSTCTLYVPKGSLSLYQAANQWEDFTHIVEFTPTQSKLINISTPGSLSATLTATELSTVTNLTVTGTIDARDFVTMRDKMPKLADIDISGVTIAAYTGTGGTYSDSISTTYPANTIPRQAFLNGNNPNNDISDTCLSSIILPTTLTAIGRSAFNRCTDLTTIKIPTSVTSIGEYAFWGCTSLPSVTIPSSISSIGNYAFGDCSGDITVDSSNANYSSLDGLLFDKKQTTLIQCPTTKTGSYIISSSVTSIGGYAFYSSGLTSIAIPSSIIFIGEYAFFGCTSLTSITIPSSVTSIEDGAFAGCSGLSSISIPSSVVSIGGDAFNMCSGSFTVDENNPNYSSKDGVLFNKNQTFLIQCPISKKGSYVIPPSVDSIDCDVFEMCSGITSITIPSSVTKIFADACFEGCINITSIYAYSSTPIVFWNHGYIWGDINTSSCILYVPKGSLSLYQAADPWKYFTHIVEFTPTAVTETPVSTVKARILNGQLIITGLNENDMVAIYTLQGIPIIRQKAQSETMALSLPAHGVYIVQTGTQSVKVVY